MNLPVYFLRIAEKIAEGGLISSRSELIRTCCLLGLPLYLETLGLLETINRWLDERTGVSEPILYNGKTIDQLVLKRCDK